MTPPKLVTITFAFRKIKTVPWWFLPSHVIVTVTGGKYCHVEAIFPDGLWYGAIGKGLRFTNKISGNKRKWEFVEILMSEAQATYFRQLCENDRGTGYDYRGVMSYVLPITEAGDKDYCSETFREKLGNTGIGLLPFWMGEKCPPDAVGKKYKGLYELLMEVRDRTVVTYKHPRKPLVSR